MKKNGFTLIELLAVIVILAIIALIATPIILGIINDAREKANERSVELYASAVRNGIAAYQLREGKKVEAKTYTKETLPFEVEYDGKIECTSIIISEDGKVSLDKCTVNNGTKEYSYGIEEESSVAKTCTIEKQDESKYSIGDVVTCNIGETPDKFYVIANAELSASTIQMLTEKNIHTTEYRQSDSAGTVTYSTIECDESNNKIRTIVNNYVSYLNTKLTNTTGSILSANQMNILGCDNHNFYTCGPDLGLGPSPYPAPNWVYLTSYGVGTIYGIDPLRDGDVFFYVDSSGQFDYGTDGNNYGVRPVITISTSDIQ